MTRSPPRSSGALLSPREEEILDLLARGYLYKEIAVQLVIAEPTVNSFVRRIYEKLQVHSRSQAVAKYFVMSRASGETNHQTEEPVGRR